MALAAADGDRRAFAEIYDRYADRLHDFCIGMLRDRDSAADCVQDAFCIASTSARAASASPTSCAPGSTPSSATKPTRDFASSAANGRPTRCPTSSRTMPGPDTLAAPHGVGRTSFPKRQAGCRIATRPSCELAYRQGLDGPELAMALGVTQTNANTMVGRLRETIERSLGALLVARRIQSDPGSCPELAAVLHGWDGKFNILMRKRIARHIESCDACEDLRRRSVSPAALLGAPGVHPGAGLAEEQRHSGTSS